MGKRQVRAAVKAIANRTSAPVVGTVELRAEETRTVVQEEEFPFKSE
jgi:hypothetical protein